jgi:hypothetical protein
VKSGKNVGLRYCAHCNRLKSRRLMAHRRAKRAEKRAA